jgi:hypothetical protein
MARAPHIPRPTRPTAAVAAALVLVLVLAVAALAPAALAGGNEGWGRYPTFMGRYHVRVISGGKLHVVGGELTMFPQEEFPGSIQPAGILKLKTKAGNNDLVYLTELSHAGRKGRLAVVTGGAFVGPKIGGFAARLLAPGRLKGRVTTRGLGTVKALFVRYSTKPTP